MEKKQKCLISAGPTREWIDPVRFISNPSSGKMGYSLARQARDRNFEVQLISGPVSLDAPSGISIEKVETAEEMRLAMHTNFPSADLIIMCAAVCDHRPQVRQFEKIKKDVFPNEIDLVPTIDILMELGKIKTDSQILVGFAAETENWEQNAIIKMKKKNLDWIALNDVSQKNIGFGSDQNEITMFSSSQKKVKFDRASKEILAKKMLELIIE
jgi:phosphopantothenoylcysteine decarboxylase/phosphopantothenate--cysteine ligase